MTRNFFKALLSLLIVIMLVCPSFAMVFAQNAYTVYSEPYGNTLSITEQPQSAKAVKVSLTAVGEELTYTWYIKNYGAPHFSKTTAVTGDTYSVIMTDERNNRQLYCVVTDKYGNRVTTDIVTISLATPVEIVKQPMSTSAPIY